MKKSFLKRAMAAAIAVPVALTQTLLCASFAADTTTEDTATAAGLGTLTVDTFMGVEADAEKNVPVLVSSGETARTYEQVSEWNVAVYGILNNMADGEVNELNPAALAATINSEAWYAEALKNAMADGDAYFQVNADNVVITVSTNYAYAADVQALLDAKLGDLTVDLGNPTSAAEIVVTVDTADLKTSKTLDASAVITVDGAEKDAAGLLAYAQTKLDEIKAAADKAAAYDAELAAEVNALFDGYQAKLDKANEKYEAAMSKSKTISKSADSLNAALASIKADYAGNAVVDKLPDTIGAVMDKDMAVNMFVEAMNQIGGIAEGYGYGVDIELGDLVDVAEGMYTVTVDASVASGKATGAVTGYAEDTISTEAFTALETYFTELEAANGYEIENFATELFIEASGNADVATISGDVTLDVTRIITYEIVEPEETTTSETDDSSVDGTTTSDTDDSGVDGTTTSDTDDSGVDGTTTSDTDDSGVDGTTTTNTDDSGVDGTTTTEETTTTTESEPVVVKTVSAVAKTDNFYFSHDDTVLTPDMLLESAALVVTTDGVDAAPVDVMENIQLGLTKDEPSIVTPAMLYAQDGNAYAYTPVYAFYVDPDANEAVLLDTEIYAYIGVKGDVTLTGEADANDAANILVFAAQVGAGNTDAKISTAEDETLERFAFFLGDTDLEGKDHNNDDLNANDSANVLRFAAMVGALTEAPTAAQVKEFWSIILGDTVA